MHFKVPERDSKKSSIAGASTLPKVPPSQSPFEASSNENIILAKKYIDTDQNTDDRMFSVDGDEMNELDAFIRREQRDISRTSHSSSGDITVMGKEHNFMSALKKDCGRNRHTFGT